MSSVRDEGTPSPAVEAHLKVVCASIAFDPSPIAIPEGECSELLQLVSCHRITPSPGILARGVIGRPVAGR